MGRFFDNETGLETIYNNGDAFGKKTHRITTSEMPKHSHGIGATRNKGSSGSGNNLAHQSEGDGYQQKTTMEAGGDQPHENMMPYLAVYKVIKIQ
ncbi:hypothetical protein D3C78_1639920 [compost metagenome]